MLNSHKFGNLNLNYGLKYVKANENFIKRFTEWSKIIGKVEFIQHY